jgi:hypothetical protein
MKIKKITAALLAFTLMVSVFSISVFAEETDGTLNPVIYPGGYEWEAKTIDLPFFMNRAVASGNGKIYVIGADEELENYVLCVCSSEPKLERLIKLPRKNSETYSGVFVSKDGNIYLLRYRNFTADNNRVTVLRLDDKTLIPLFEAQISKEISLWQNFFISETDTTVVIENNFYNYKTHSFYKSKHYDFAVDENGDLVSYKKTGTSKINVSYSNLNIWKYNDFDVSSNSDSEKTFNKSFSSIRYSNEYKKPDLIIKNGDDFVGYNYDNAAEVTRLISDEHIGDGELYDWCTVDAETIADIGYYNDLTVYHNTKKAYPDVRLIRVAYSKTGKNGYAAEYIAKDFNKYSADFEAIATPWKKGSDYDILILSERSILSDNNVKFDAESDTYNHDKTGEATLGDIYDLMGNRINNETTYMKMLEANETDGKLYLLTPRYYFNIPIAYAGFVEDNAFKTWDELIALEKNTKNWLFPCYGPDTLFFRFFDFIYLKNADSGITKIDTPQLKKLLEFCEIYRGGTQTEEEIKRREESPNGPKSYFYGPNAEYFLPDAENVEFITKDIRDKYYLTTIFNGNEPYVDTPHDENLFINFSAYKNIAFSGEDISFPGFPEMGQVILSQAYNGLSVTVPEKPFDTESARAFISWICAGDMALERSYYITPSKLSMKATAAAALETPRTHINEKGEIVRDTVTVDWLEIEIPDVTETDVNELLSAFEGDIYVGNREILMDSRDSWSYSFDLIGIAHNYFSSGDSYEKLVAELRKAVLSVTQFY